MIQGKVSTPSHWRITIRHQRASLVNGHLRRIDVGERDKSLMPVTDLTLRLIAASTPSDRFSNYSRRLINLFYPKRGVVTAGIRSMADKSTSKDTQTVNVDESEGEKQKESEKLTPPSVPPPPEKPLPGDCCGSGCVRCVWDVYYEELEEYNTLYKAQ